MFCLKCPKCDFWQSQEMDERYRPVMYRLDCIRDYEVHYRRHHAHIPLPAIINQGDT